ncbi:MAG: family 20 glycosylhydrolase [Proteobacteria bacterium]|nr:family 20 glycosylhydrolase [Pseudomonadota bacterium]
MSDLPLMPWPQKLVIDETQSVSTANLRVRAGPQVSPRVKKALERHLRSNDESTDDLLVTLNGGEATDLENADEGYRLLINEDGVDINAPTDIGMLRGLATLRQLLGASSVPHLLIEDTPRFGWRGLMLDTARHFIGVEALERTLDIMELFKLNVLHLHLSDDQGFRFPSTRYPELMSAQAYSVADLHRVIEAATARGIRVIPELDMPGHVTCWLVGLPELGLKDVAPTIRFGVHKACLDPTRELTYDVVDALIGELAEIFPDSLIHIGGDEVHPAWWSESRAVQTFMHERAIPDIAALQAYFIGRVADIAASHNRNIIGWDEVLHDDVASSVIVQTWRGATARNRALAAGHKVIVSSGYYLDLFYPADVYYRYDPQSPESTLVQLEDDLLKDRRFDHVAEGMKWTHQWRQGKTGTELDLQGVLGAEACLWSELVEDEVLDVRLWTRLPALAERFWSAADCTDLASMYDRLQASADYLAESSVLDLTTRVHRQLLDLGLNEQQIEMTRLVEPVKWYARLLGATALAARLQGREMPQARPYDTTSSLNRAADILPSESLPARRINQQVVASLAGDREATEQMRELNAAWHAQINQPWPEDLVAVVQALTLFTATVLDLADGLIDEREAQVRFATCAQPADEYILALSTSGSAGSAGVDG